MRSCKECGAYISDEDFDVYHGYCVNCLQTIAKQMAITDRPSSPPLVTCSYCSNTAVIKCTVCGKPLCQTHIMVRKSNPDPRFGRCRDCAKQIMTTQQSSGMSSRSICSIVVIVLKIILLIIVLASW